MPVQRHPYIPGGRHNKANQQPFLEQQFHSLASLKIAGYIICYLITCWLVTVGQVSGAVETPLDSEFPWETIIGWGSGRD